MENLNEKNLISALNNDGVLNGIENPENENPENENPENENPENENPETEKMNTKNKNRDRKRENKNDSKKRIPSKRKTGIFNCTFGSGTKHETAFSLLARGITFENFRAKMTERYGEKTGHIGNCRMYLANIRNAGTPIYYNAETGIYKIGHGEKSEKNPKIENPETV